MKHCRLGENRAVKRTIKRKQLRDIRNKLQAHIEDGDVVNDLMEKIRRVSG